MTAPESPFAGLYELRSGYGSDDWGNDSETIDRWYQDRYLAVRGQLEADAEKRGAVKALRAEAERGRAAAEKADPKKLSTFTRRVADAIDARADQIESGEVEL